MNTSTTFAKIVIYKLPGKQPNGLSRAVESQNKRDRWHWTQRHKEKNSWSRYIRMAVGGEYNKPDAARKVIIKSYRVRLFDDHANFVGGCKGLVDAIVDVGLLKDDADQWASIRYEQEKCKRGDQRTEILIEGFKPIHEIAVIGTPHA